MILLKTPSTRGMISQPCFGDEIAALVDGVSKLSQIELQPGQSSQA